MSRYDQNIIYTNVGDILVALNPFQDLPYLYADDASQLYFHDKEPVAVPHVFAVAQKAYKTLLHSHKNQVGIRTYFLVVLTLSTVLCHQW